MIRINRRGFIAGAGAAAAALPMLGSRALAADPIKIGYIYVGPVDDGGWTTAGHPVLAPAVDDVESAILDASSKGFLDESDAKALGAPDATVTVKSKTETWIVTIHPRAGGAAAKVSGRPGAFAIDPALTAQLQEAFQKAVTPPPTPKAGDVETGFLVCVVSILAIWYLRRPAVKAAFEVR